MPARPRGFAAAALGVPAPGRPHRGDAGGARLPWQGGSSGGPMGARRGRPGATAPAPAGGEDRRGSGALLGGAPGGRAAPAGGGAGGRNRPGAVATGPRRGIFGVRYPASDRSDGGQIRVIRGGLRVVCPKYILRSDGRSPLFDAVRRRGPGATRSGRGGGQAQLLGCDSPGAPRVRPSARRGGAWRPQGGLAQDPGPAPEEGRFPWLGDPRRPRRHPRHPRALVPPGRAENRREPEPHGPPGGGRPGGRGRRSTWPPFGQRRSGPRAPRAATPRRRSTFTGCPDPTSWSPRRRRSTWGA